jgi:bla regulator protein blaR1
MPWLSTIASNVALASLVAMAAWIVQRKLGRPGVARVLWVLALVKLVTPPLVSMPVGEASGATACALGVCSCGPHPGAPTFLRFTLPWVLLAVWSAGACATLIVAWRRWSRFQQMLAHASPAAPRWQSLAARLAAELSLRQAPAVLAVPGRLPPLVVPGWRRPRLLLPMDFMDRLTARQRETLLLHELAHIKRGDHLVRLLELAVGVVFWWLPGVGSIGRQLRVCEEACCDAAVVELRPRARRDYARLLLDVVDFADPLPRQALVQATAMSAAEGLEQRLRSILVPLRGPSRAGPVTALSVGLACAVLPCGVHYGVARSEIQEPAPVAISEQEDATASEGRWDGCEPPLEPPAFGCPTFEAAEG